MDVVFIGIQGSGKGTQAAVIAEKHGYEIIGMGDLFRTAAEEDSERGREIKEMLNSGQLLPDELAEELFREKLAVSNDKSLILDGFPRTPAQQEIFMRAYDDMQRDFEVIYIMLDEEEAVKRIAQRAKEQGRADDQNPEQIQKRIDEFYKKTAPLVDTFETATEVHRIDGGGTVEQVTEDIELALRLKSLEKIA